MLVIDSPGFWANGLFITNGTFDEDNARRLAACWNACAGFDNELLENIDLMGDTLKQRFEGMQAEVRRVDADASAIEANYEAARTLLKDVMDDVPANYSDPLTRRIRAFLKGRP